MLARRAFDSPPRCPRTNPVSCSWHEYRTIDRKATGKVKVDLFQKDLSEIVRKRPDFRCPDEDVIKEVLLSKGEEDVMFNAFCVKLFKHPHLEDALHFTPPFDQLKHGIGKLVRELSKFMT